MIVEKKEMDVSSYVLLYMFSVSLCVCCLCSLWACTSQWCVEEVGPHTPRVKGHPGGYRPKEKVHGRE